MKLVSAIKILVITQSPNNVSGTSLADPQKGLTSKIYRRASGESQATNTKIYDLIINCFLETMAIVPVRPAYQIMGHSRDVWWKSGKHVS